MYFIEFNYFFFCRDEESAIRAKNADPHELKFYDQTMIVSNVSIFELNFLKFFFSIFQLVLVVAQHRIKLQLKVNQVLVAFYTELLQNSLMTVDACHVLHQHYPFRPLEPYLLKYFLWMNCLQKLWKASLKIWD